MYFYKPTMFDKQQYFIASMENRNSYPDNKIYKCIMIYKTIDSLQDFCINLNYNGDGECYNEEYDYGIYTSIYQRKEFFTLKLTYYNKIFKVFTNIYFTFRLINDKFYLHQYSKEEIYFNPADDEERTVDKAIYYRQPRDDPKKEKLIFLDDINDELSQKLSKKCLN